MPIDQPPTVDTGRMYRGQVSPSSANTPEGNNTQQLPAAAPPPQATTRARNPLYTAPQNGLTTFAVVVIIVGLTAAVGFIDMAMNRQLTWWSGAVFIIACGICALAVRPRDLWMAVVVAPLCYLAALVIAGQPTTVSGGGSLLLREVAMIGTGLAFNAPFIFGGTALALIIVLIRRAGLMRRAR